MKTISLTQGYEALLDDADYEIQSHYKWHVHIGSHGSIYARRTVTISKGKRQHLWLHCEIMGVKRGDGQEVDHKDRDGLNDQRHNLRVCTHKKNSYNRKTHGGASQYRGVTRCGTKWRAALSDTHLGTFESEKLAAEMYDDAARRAVGEFASLNFPDRQPPAQGVQ